MSRWMIAAKRADFQEIAKKFGIDQVTARLLRNRDIIGDEAIRAFLSGDLSLLHDGRLMLDMERGASIVAEAIREGRRIRIIGDYDVDGICATYILCRGLRKAGSDSADAVLPDRIRDGYGLNASLVRNAAEDGVQMLLTCDNGIRAIDEIALARELGMTVVVTDHHEPRRDGDMEVLPDAADAVVDPSREGDPYPYPSICGAVVAWKFVAVLLEMTGSCTAEEQKRFLEELLPFAAFATNCDVMPLMDENRIIMREGIRKIADGENIGLSELIRACGLKEDAIRAQDFGYTLGPCLNATGRLDSAHRGLNLLECQNREEAAGIAGDLLALNSERKTMTAEGVNKACEIISGGGFEDDTILVIYLPECHESVAGIIAGRIRERYGKPSIVLTDCAEAGLIKGSGRSVPGFDLYRALSAQEDLFVRFGGHEQAAGLTLRGQDLEELRRRLNENNSLTEGDLDPVLHIDMEMPLSYVTLDLVRQFSVLEPFGKGNPEPLFAARDLAFYGGRILGKNKNVGKYTVRDAAGNSYELMMFDGLGRFHEMLTERFGAGILTKLYDSFAKEKLFTCHVAYQPQINVYQERERLQFRVADVMII